MPTKQVTTRYIRFATRERPTDRFLTAQIREMKDEDDRKSAGDLYFVVEIHNPWFPNSQIGQTIINTAVREFRRGESTSTLTNFELALRKTNAVLAQITQTGETDWIGNLSSIIALVSDGHIYLAQTGRAHGYLLRENKISEITEGLDEEATQHPLTTYTNITSGSLQTADRVLLASSQVAETVTLSDLKTLFTDPSLHQASREFVGFLQQHRARRVNGFIIEADPTVETVSETIYTDETINTFLENATRLFHKHIRPQFHRSVQYVRTQAGAAQTWTREWLVPKLIDWSGKTGASLKRRTRELTTSAQPFLQKTRQRASELLPKTPAPDEALKNESLIGKTIYRVHHYQDEDERPTLSPVKEQVRPTTAPLTKWFEAARAWMTKKPTKIKLSQNQLVLLGVAGLVLIVVLVTTLRRHTSQLAQTEQTQATDALSQAQAAQKAAERAFILGQKEIAKTDYTQAISLAEKANDTASTQAAAAAVISASENVLDQLISATRADLTTPLMAFEKPVTQLGVTATDVVAVENSSVLQAALNSQSGGAAPATSALPGAASANNIGAFMNAQWFIAGAADNLYSYNLANKTAEKVTVTGGLKPTIGLAVYGSTLYGLDTTNGQIWKYPVKQATASAATGYFKTADPTTLSSAIGLAIDGDVFVLASDGSVKKYTKGVLVQNWKLSNIPTPWDNIAKPLAIYADANANRLYVFDQGASNQPGRILEFDKNGSFTRQVLLPEDVHVSTLAFDPVTAQGVIIDQQKAYRVSFPKS